MSQLEKNLLIIVIIMRFELPIHTVSTLGCVILMKTLKISEFQILLAGFLSKIGFWSDFFMEHFCRKKCFRHPKSELKFYLFLANGKNIYFSKSLFLILNHKQLNLVILLLVVNKKLMYFKFLYNLTIFLGILKQKY